MASDDNTAYVEIGAKIDKLIDATNQVSDQVRAMKEKAESLGEGFKQVGEALAAAFSVEKIVSFIEKMGELGLQTERTMAMLGLSAESTLQLGGMAKLTGSSLEGMTMSLERLYLNAQRSTRDGFNPAAQGFKVLGINAKELISLKPEDVFDRLQLALSKLNPSFNTTTAAMAAGGRGIAQNLPLLLLSRDKYLELRAAVDETRAGIAASVPHMAETHANMTMMTLASESLSVTLYAALRPAIDGTIKTLTDFVKQLRESAKEGGALEDTFRLISAAGKITATVIVAVTATIMGLAYATEAVLKLAIGDIAEFEKNAKTSADALETLGRTTVARLHEIWSAPMQMTVHPTGSDAGAMDVDARKRIETAITGIEEEMSIVGSYYAKLKEIYQIDVDVFGASVFKKTMLTLEATKQQAAIDDNYLSQIRDKWEIGTKEYEEAEKKRLAASQKTELEILKLSGAALKEQKAQWDTILFNPLLSAWDSQLKGLLAGTVKFKDAMKSVLGDILIEWIKMLEKKAAAWASGELAMVFATEAAETTKTTSVALGVTTRTAIEKTGVLASIATTAGSLFAKLTEFFSFLGPGAPAAAAGETAGIVGTSIAMASAAGGAWEVRQGPYMLHDRETVLPAAASDTFRKMAAGQMPGMSGGDVHLHVNAIDTQSGLRFVQNHLDAIARGLKSKLRDVPSLSPA